VCTRLREVGRFTLGHGTALGSEREQSVDSLWVNKIIGYVVNRQNNDGGYSFCQGTESNAQDTYYGLAILDLLKVPFPNIGRTVKWLRDFVPQNHYSFYYVYKALRLCGQDPDKKPKTFLILSKRFFSGKFGAIHVYAEVASEFEATFMITELANMMGVEIDRKKTIDWLLSFQNSDGGFGVQGHSNLNSTYHAVASLSSLGYSVKSLRETLAYVRSCEKPTGGFTVTPASYPPYMEHVYYGVSTLDLLGEHARYPEKTAQFVFSCQNSNGGFARSDLGISTFEDTSYAVHVLRKIGRI